MPELVIDLGEDRERGHDELRPPHWTVRHVKRFGSLLIALVMPIATLAGASPKPDPPLTLLARVADPGEKGDQRVQLLEGAFIKREGGDLVVVGLDGVERWRLVSEPKETAAVDADDGLLIVLRYGDGTSPFTEAFDLDSGASRWTLPGWGWVVGDFLTLRDDDVIRVYRKSDLRPQWSAKMLTFAPDPARHTLLALTRDGVLTERDLATGAPVRSAVVSDLARSDQAILQVGLDHVVATRLPAEGQEGTKSVFLERDTLRPIPEHLAHWREGYDCGPMTCALSRRGGSAVIDPATGAVRWQMPPGWTVTGLGSRLLAVEPPRSLAPWRWWAGEFDPATGRRVRRMSGWIALVGMGREVAPIALKPSDGRTRVAVLTSTGMRQLGNLPGERSICRYRAHLLSCRAPDNFTEVWRVDF